MELRERLMWDIREGMVGTVIFRPKHAIIVTWKNVTFAGGSVNTDAKFVVRGGTKGWSRGTKISGKGWNEAGWREGREGGEKLIVKS